MYSLLPSFPPSHSALHPWLLQKEAQQRALQQKIKAMGQNAAHHAAARRVPAGRPPVSNRARSGVCSARDAAEPDEREEPDTDEEDEGGLGKVEGRRQVPPEVKRMVKKMYPRMQRGKAMGEATERKDADLTGNFFNMKTSRQGERTHFETNLLFVDPQRQFMLWVCPPPLPLLLHLPLPAAPPSAEQTGRRATERPTKHTGKRNAGILQHVRMRPGMSGSGMQ